MKKAKLLLFFLLVSSASFSQKKPDSTTTTIGLFKHVRAGLTLSYFHNFQGDYAYILQQNARVIEKAENKDGAVLSVVILFPLDEKSKWNFLLNLNIADAKKDDLSFFNSQTPFGVGLSCFPFKRTQALGFSAMANFGKISRMRKDAIETTFFPIADYPKEKMIVGAPVPSTVLDPFYHKIYSVSTNAGIIIRL